MSIPTLEQYRKSGASWSGEHRGVGYKLSHHGISDYSPEGTWCYYLFLRPDMFQRAEDFALFDKPAEVKPSPGTDKFWETHDYDAIPDLDFHGGVTWYSKEPYMDRFTGERRECLKIGCDYAHAWDRDEGYWQGLEDVERDAKHSIDILVDQFPMNERCRWSGIMAVPEEFYTAVNGAKVHKSQLGKIDHELWQPAPVETPA